MKYLILNAIKALDKCYPSESERYSMLQMHVTLCDNRLKITFIFLHLKLPTKSILNKLQCYFDSCKITTIKLKSSRIPCKKKTIPITLLIFAAPRVFFFFFTYPQNL